MLPYDLDPWQYRLSREPVPEARRLTGWSVEIGPGLGCCELREAGGRPVGWLIGFPLNLETGQGIGADLTLPFTLTEDRDAFAEHVLTRLAGRFLWLADLAGQARIYPDASALVPCVFDPERRVAGSTAHALLSPQEYESRFDKARFDRFDIAGSGWFPAGLTAHRGIERLLPNHYLDLGTFMAVRHWPMRALSARDDPDAVVHELVDLVRRQLLSLAESEKTVALTLTAGRDTRILLAAARPFLERITFATVVAGDSHAVDTVMARRIAADLGLKLRELPRTRADRAAHDLYMRRGGHCIGDANAWYFPSIAPLAADHVLVGGAGGEAGRAFYWRATDTADTVLSGALLAGRMGLPSDPELIARLDDWLAGTGQDSALMTLDLAYVEHRMGPWGAAQFCNDPTMVRIAPMVSRRGIELLLALPDDWKRGERLAQEVMRQAWPELARYPFNSLGPARDILSRIQKALTNPGRAVRKIRKVLTR